MIMGGELDNPEYLKVIEAQGGLVVTDSLCFGSRMIWRDVDQNIDDPLTALAQYYVADRPSCARMYTRYGERVKFIKNMIKDFNVNGVIFVRLTFCELWGFEQYSLENDFKESENTPSVHGPRIYSERCRSVENKDPGISGDIGGQTWMRRKREACPE